MIASATMTDTSSSRRGTGGFTFIELLVTLAILLFILVSAYNVIDTSQRITANQEELADMDASARTAMDIMSSEIREGGFSIGRNDYLGMTPAVAFVTVAGTMGESIDIRRDLNGDLDTRDANGEWVRYEWTNVVGGVGQLVRTSNTDGNDALTAADTKTVLAKNVLKVVEGATTHPIFVYRNLDGIPMTTIIEIEQQLASVFIRFRVRSALKDRQTRKYREISMREMVVLRNLRLFPGRLEP